MGVFPCVVCGDLSAYFSSGKYYCTKHPPAIEQNIAAPVEHKTWEAATDFVTVEERLRRIERIIEEWRADS